MALLLSRAFRALAATSVVLIALAGCTASTEPAASPSATPSIAPAPPPVDEVVLGEVLDHIVYGGGAPLDDDGGACFAAAVRDTDISERALTHLAALSTDDWGEAIARVDADVSPEDAEILASDGLHAAIDACVDSAVATALPDGGSRVYEGPAEDAVVGAHTEGDADMKPAHPQPEGEIIRSSGQLDEGLASMFASFARDDHQREVFAAAAECFAAAAFKAGFSQETLVFLAGGAPLGSGSIVEHLATDADRDLWQSPAFQTVLSGCVSAAETTIAEDDDADED